jgi:hypothetical protein
MTMRRIGRRRLGTQEVAEIVRLLVGEQPSRRLVDALFERTDGDPRRLLVHLLVAFADEEDLPAALEQLAD